MADSWWDNFSNNLATDLAPLIALFGESPTKQYLSECLSNWDIIIFASAPLGVITAVVSAIRVCGTPSLRAFIGRAQEGAGIAEAELCSSTSRDVSELYNNGGFARVFGHPKLLEIVHDSQAASSASQAAPTTFQTPQNNFFDPDRGHPIQPTAGIYLFKDYIETAQGKDEWERQEWKMPPNLIEDGITQHKTEAIGDPFRWGPNLSINVGIKPRSKGWFILAAISGTIMQSFTLVWAWITRYHYRWLRNSREGWESIPSSR